MLFGDRGLRETVMQKAQLDRSKTLLEAKEAELLRGLRHREGIAIEKTPDVLEEGQLAVQRELAIRNLNRESALLRSVRSALQRIAHGIYGICTQCEESITPRRLEALPWAEYCVRCQEAADRNLNLREPDSAESFPSERAA